MDATVSLFELETMTCLRTFSKFDHPARGVSFSADSSYIAYFAEGTLGINIEKTFTGDGFSTSCKPLSNDWFWSGSSSTCCNTESKEKSSVRSVFSVYNISPLWLGPQVD